jgi:hypothetical protein
MAHKIRHYDVQSSRGIHKTVTIVLTINHVQTTKLKLLTDDKKEGERKPFALMNFNNNELYNESDFFK